MKTNIDCIILDRDGVINHDSAAYIKTPDEWHAIDGSLEAIAIAKQHGIKVFVATNQSGLARGLFDSAALNNIFAKMQQQAQAVGGNIDDIAFCPHHPDDNCDCRKPKPGLILQLIKKHQLDLRKSVFIGDSKRDIDAAVNANVTPILVKTGNGIKTLEKHPQLLNSVHIEADLLTAVKNLLHT